MATDYPRSGSLFIRLPHEVLEMIRQQHAGSVHLFRGGGATGWVRNLIYRELGLEPPRQPGEEVYRPSYELPLREIIPEKLPPSEELVLRLGQRGRSLGQIARYLNDQEVPAPPGSKKWRSYQIEKIINRILISRFPIADAPQK